jgi:hypothetical protein
MNNDRNKIAIFSLILMICFWVYVMVWIYLNIFS